MVKQETIVERVAFRVSEVAALLGISRNKVYELVARRKLRSTQIGRSWRVPRAALAEFLGDPSLLQDPAPPHSPPLPAATAASMGSVGFEGRYVVTISRLP